MTISRFGQDFGDDSEDDGDVEFPEAVVVVWWVGRRAFRLAPGAVMAMVVIVVAVVVVVGGAHFGLHQGPSWPWW
jgi:hypothetical protein